MKTLKKFWEAIGNERTLINTMAVVCTAITFFMLLFINEEPEFDAIMIVLNGILVAAALYWEE